MTYRWVGRHVEKTQFSLTEALNKYCYASQVTWQDLAVPSGSPTMSTMVAICMEQKDDSEDGNSDDERWAGSLVDNGHGIRWEREGVWVVESNDFWHATRRGVMLLDNYPSVPEQNRGSWNQDGLLRTSSYRLLPESCLHFYDNNRLQRGSTVNVCSDPSNRIKADQSYLSPRRWIVLTNISRSVFFLYFLISSPKINFFFFISTKNYHHCRSRSEILSDIFWFNLFSIYSTLLSFYILCLYFLHMIYSWTYDAFPFKPIRCSVHYLDGFLRCKPIVLFFLNYFQYWKTKNFHATHVFLSFRISTLTNI